MANVNTIKTRILNKYDVLANYTNFTPLKGEVCIAIIGEETTTNKGLKGDVTKKPIVGIKVGDGNDTPFNELPWIQAVAGDVSTFIKGIVDEAKFNELVNALIANAKLATAKDLSDLTDRVAANESNITNLKAIVETGDNSNENLRKAITDALSQAKTYAEEQASSALTEAKGYTDTRETAILSAAAATAQDKVDALANDRVKKAEDAIAGINTEIGEVTYAGNSLTDAINKLQASVGTSGEGLGSQVSALNTKVNNLETTVGNSTSGLVKNVADLQTAISDTGALGSRVKTLEDEMDVVQAATAGYNGTNTISGAIKVVSDANVATNAIAEDAQSKANTLMGSDTGRSARDIAELVISDALVSGGEDFDTLQEIASWIKDHPQDAAAMNAAITSVKQNLGYTGENLGTAPATVDSRITAAISALEEKINISNYATTAQLGATNDKVTALENKVDTGDQKVSAYVEAAKQAAISAAATDATTKANAAQTAAEITAAADATTKANDALAAAEAKITALAGSGNTSTVKTNADAIAGLDTTIKGMDASYTDDGTGAMFGITQTDGKITATTRRKIKNADLDTSDVFVFYCGNASGYDDPDMKTVDI